MHPILEGEEVTRKTNLDLNPEIESTIYYTPMEKCYIWNYGVHKPDFIHYEGGHKYQGMCILGLPFDHPEFKKGRTLGYVKLLKEYMQAIEEVDSLYTPIKQKRKSEKSSSVN